MEDIDSSPPSPNPRKRAAPDEDSPEKKPLNLKGTQFMMPTPPDTDQSSNASPKCNEEITARETSPAPSSSALSSVEFVSSNSGINTTTIEQSGSAPAASASGQPPKKKRKLTPAEKEQQQREKETKAVEKAAEKARKDAEKAQRDAEKAEEKRIKDDEKRKKAEEREAKKREKELDEERKAQDKLKKERSQMRLGAFAFVQKLATPAKEVGDGETVNSARRKSLSLEPFEAVVDQIRGSASPCKGVQQSVDAAEKTPVKSSLSDYRKHFLPFQLKTHSFLAPARTLEDPQTAQASFDYEVNDPLLREKFDLGLVNSYASLESHFGDERQSTRGSQFPNMRQLVDQIQGSIQQPIDLTNDRLPSNPVDNLQAVSRRYLEFHEDVRPPYFGSYTKIKSPRTSKKLSRNPFSRTRKDTDYDYDSEAEWDEPDGEDIMDEEDDEMDSVGDANEMDEFLDDEDDAMKHKRKMITGDLMPASTGLCWEDVAGKLIPSVEGSSPITTVRAMRMGILVPGFNGTTIDPFSTVYWESDNASTQAAPAPAGDAAPQSADMTGPARPPLQARPNSNGTLDRMFAGGVDSSVPSTATLQVPKATRKPTPKPLSKEDLEEFKVAVVGSQLTKADLLKDLKTRFPKITNDTIKSTLGDHFAQVGAKAADKKWVFVSV